MSDTSSRPAFTLDHLAQVERSEQLQKLLTPERRFALGFVADVEGYYLIADALRSYVNGADASAIFCAHATCERELALVVAERPSQPKNWERWGLGPLVSHCASENLLPQTLVSRLNDLNDHRKTLYHFGHTDSDSALMARAHAYVEEIESEGGIWRQFEDVNGFKGDTKEVWRFALDTALKLTALESIETALMLREETAPSWKSDGVVARAQPNQEHEA